MNNAIWILSLGVASFLFAVWTAERSRVCAWIEPGYDWLGNSVVWRGRLNQGIWQIISWLSFGTTLLTFIMAIPMLEDNYQILTWLANISPAGRFFLMFRVVTCAIAFSAGIITFDEAS